MNLAQQPTTARPGRTASLMVATLACTAMLALTIAEASAAGRGGGARGGGGGARASSGQMAHSSVSGANRSASGGNRASTGTANRGNANTGNANRGNVNSGNVNTGNVNRGNINTGNVNTGNVNIGNDVNIDIDGGYGYRGGVYHPVAAGMVIGAVAVTTAAVVGSYYYSLPPGCTTVYKAGVNYHYCGSVYYQQTWSGDKVVYVVATP